MGTAVFTLSDHRCQKYLAGKDERLGAFVAAQAVVQTSFASNEPTPLNYSACGIAAVGVDSMHTISCHFGNPSDWNYEESARGTDSAIVN